MEIRRGGDVAFADATSTAEMRRGFEELAEALFRAVASSRRRPVDGPGFTGTPLPRTMFDGDECTWFSFVAGDRFKRLDGS
jgi:hypothetical protein